MKLVHFTLLSLFLNGISLKIFTDIGEDNVKSRILSQNNRKLDGGKNKKNGADT